MHALEFLRPGKAKGEIRPLYALVGDDGYLRRESIGQIVRLASGGEDDDGAVTRFPGDSARLADVLDEVRTLPFLTARRVVVVESADAFVTAHRKELERYAEHPVASGTLVLGVKSWPANTRLAKLFTQHGLAVECKTPGDAELPGWLARVASERLEVTLDDEAAHLLVAFIGAEVGVLVNEVEKLATFVGERRRIGPDDVRRLVEAGRVESIWRVLEYATTGRAAQALDQLDRLLTSGEYPAALLAAMAASLRKVYHAGMLRKRRLALADACREAGVPNFRGAIDLVQRQHAHLGPERVERLPGWLLAADLDLKGSSQLPPRVILEQLLVRLAAPRRD